MGEPLGGPGGGCDVRSRELGLLAAPVAVAFEDQLVGGGGEPIDGGLGSIGVNQGLRYTQRGCLPLCGGNDLLAQHTRCRLPHPRVRNRTADAGIYPREVPASCPAGSALPDLLDAHVPPRLGYTRLGRSAFLARSSMGWSNGPFHRSGQVTFQHDGG